MQRDRLFHTSSLTSQSVCCEWLLTSSGMDQANHNRAQTRPFIHCWAEDLAWMNNVNNHAADLISSVAITRTEPVADVVAGRTWPLSSKSMSVWLILLYKVLWHCRVLIVSRTSFPFGVAWVITKQEHHIETLRSPGWTIVDRYYSTIVVCISFNHTLGVGAYYL